MGELVQGDKPKGLEYVEKLLNYDQPQTWPEKIKARFTSEKTKANTYSKWCRILGSTRTNQHTRKFLDYLIEHEALQLVQDNGDQKKYSLNKEQLLDAIRESYWWEQHRDLAFQIIQNSEPNRKLVRDF